MKGQWKYDTQLYLIFGILSLSNPAFSLPSEGLGKVTMSGEILDTACTIATESRDQTIDMGIVPISILKQLGKAPPKSFDILLVNCRWERYPSSKGEWQTFDVTFDGPANDEFFTVNGEAKGVKLAMRDSFGYTVIAGKPLPKREIVPGDMTLKYELQLVVDNQRLQAGSYQTLLHFKIDYY